MRCFDCRRPTASFPQLRKAVEEIAASDHLDDGLRVKAAAAVPQGMSAVTPPAFQLLRQQIASDNDAARRAWAVRALGECDFDRRSAAHAIVRSGLAGTDGTWARVGRLQTVGRIDVGQRSGHGAGRRAVHADSTAANPACQVRTFRSPGSRRNPSTSAAVPIRSGRSPESLERAVAAAVDGRYSSRSARVSQRQGGLRRLPRDGIPGRQDRARSHADWSDSISSRSAGGDRVPQCQFRAKLRNADGC